MCPAFSKDSRSCVSNLLILHAKALSDYFNKGERRVL